MAFTDEKFFQQNLARKKDNQEPEEHYFSSPRAFEQLFKKYYQNLCQFCFHYVKQEETAEEIVQDVFVKLWQLNKQPDFHTSVKAYLYAAVKNGSLNYLKSQFARQQFEGHGSQKNELQSENTQETIEFEELSKLVGEAVAKLPQQCRIIFEMSRTGGHTYQEISKELNISPKTVENQMGIALKKLKEHLRTYWDMLVIMLVMLSFIHGNF